MPSAYWPPNPADFVQPFVSFLCAVGIFVWLFSIIDDCLSDDDSDAGSADKP